MSDTNDITSELKEGQLQLYDFYQPSLEAGNYHVHIEQTLTIPGADAIAPSTDLVASFTAQQKFVVSAPQYALNPSQIINQYPPAGSTGKYAEVLPHIVLKDPMLAWERAMNGQVRGAENPIPWLALLVFDESDLLPGGLPATQTSTISIDDFRAMRRDEVKNKDSTLLVPFPEQEHDVDGKSACQYIRVTAETFKKVVPLLDELRYLSHVRKVNTGDRPALDLHEHGLFSVTMANRFPNAPAAGSDPKTVPAVKNIVHLVSLEGLEDHLTDAGVKSPYTEVALISLASWTFFALGDSRQDFAGLARTLLTGDAKGKQALPRETRLLRMPGLDRAAPGDTSVAENVRLEVRDRLRLGYVPLAYHTRSGEDTLAWYRGPLVPQLPGANASASPSGPLHTADAALVYDPAFDVFDVSLAAAWELGREAALADVAFGPKLLHLRRQAAGLLDLMHHQQSSTAAQMQQASAGQPPAPIHEVMMDRVAGTLLADIGNIGARGGVSPAQAAAIASQMNNTTSAPATGADVAAELKELLRPENNAMLAQLEDDLQPLVTWLSRLLLLWQVPFDNLVPDERLLPPDSLRFFHLDENWFRASLDGALSLGLDSSKQIMLNDLLRDTVLGAVKKAAGSTKDKEGISGFLLRSDLVVGWPNLAVYAKTEVCREKDIITGPACAVLRIDHLAPGVLLCLFDGVPKQVVLSEPAESLRFGAEDDWNIDLRRPTNSSESAKDIGETTTNLWEAGTPAEQNKEKLLRSPASRVLNLNRLVDSMNKKLSETLNLSVKLGPAAFSLQLIKAPESIELPAPPTPEQPAA